MGFVLEFFLVCVDGVFLWGFCCWFFVWVFFFFGGVGVLASLFL